MLRDRPLLLLIPAALLLLATTAGSLWLFSFGRRCYLDLNATRLDPLGIGSFPASSVRPAGPVVVMFGDSRAAHWPAPDEPAGVTFINRGIAGQTTSQILGRLEAHVLPLKPDVVVLQAGINDLKAIALFPSRATEITDRCIRNLREIVMRLEASGAVVVVTTIFPHGKVPLHRRPFFTEAVDLATEQVNQALGTLASDRIRLFRSDETLAERSNRIRPEFSRDLLHVNESGYTALNKALVPMLHEVLRPDSTVSVLK